MNVQQAVENFNAALRHCDNIIEIHRDHGGPNRGRRPREKSLNRAAIVLAVAAWQAAVQDLTTALLDTARPSGPSSIDVARYDALVGSARKAIGDFATPNAENTRKLMVGAGFDPRPHWGFDLPGANGHWTPDRVAKRLNEWLKVRHALAHGHEVLPPVDALLTVRTKKTFGDPWLELADVEDCIRFLNRLVRVTSAGLAAHLGVKIRYPRP